jgi:hypothetical protein
MRRLLLTQRPLPCLLSQMRRTWVASCSYSRQRLRAAQLRGCRRTLRRQPWVQDRSTLKRDQLQISRRPLLLRRQANLPPWLFSPPPTQHRLW